MATSVLKVVGKAAGAVRRGCLVTAARRRFSSSKAVTSGIPGSLWKLGRLNHIAIAVPDLEKAAALYRDVLGAQVSAAVPLPEHGVYTVFVELGNTKLELLHPLGDKSPIAGFLQKNKSGGMHHICIEVYIRSSFHTFCSACCTSCRTLNRTESFELRTLHRQYVA
uniref:Methylmalonyl CoA epimerase n=1 Tax=Scleropages formosus TaxID=113540 RepID=A0A8C9VEK7_SCLFO